LTITITRMSLLLRWKKLRLAESTTKDGRRFRQRDPQIREQGHFTTRNSP
jgi:hypothetical protein